MKMRKYKLIEIPQIKGKYATLGDGWSDKKIELPRGKQLYKAATIMRAKPPHRNHIAMLEALCQKSEYLTINIGSANKLDSKNPFHPEETEDMLRLGLKSYDNFNIIPIPDFDDPVTGDDQWGDYLFEKNPKFTEFICNNDWVLGILQERQYILGEKQFDILFPDQILPQREMIYEDGVYISATVVRTAMANGDKWERFLLPDIADYIKKNNLVRRVKKYAREYAKQNT